MNDGVEWPFGRSTRAIRVLIGYPQHTMAGNRYRRPARRSHGILTGEANDTLT
jgi:hypothetical protein